MLSAGLALSFPFFALYLHKVRGIPMDMVGAGLSLVLGVSALAQAWGGELADTLGNKPVMVGALFLRTICVGAMAWAIEDGWGYPALVGLHAAGGFFGHFFDPALRSWLAEGTAARDRVDAYARLRVVVNAGWAIGPAIGGLMAERSYTGLFTASAAACAGCLILVAWGIPAGAPVRQSEGFSLKPLVAAARDRRYLEFCAYGVIIAAVMAQLVVSLSVHSVSFAGLTEREVGLLFTVNALVVVATQTAITGRLRRSRITSALAVGSLFYALGFGAVGFARGFAAMALAVVVVSIGEVIVSPGLTALAANMAPDKFRGRYLGFQGLTQSAGFALGPLLGGAALRYLSPHWVAGPWIMVGAAGAVAGGGFFRLRRVLADEEEGLEVSRD